MNARTAGWSSGLAGVLFFSGSLPATRVAVGDLTPLFLTSARAVIAGVIGAIVLGTLRQAPPERRDVGPLLMTALGGVVGFPLLAAFALQQIDSARATVFIGLLPLITAVFARLKGGERPGAGFWLFSVLGAAVVVGFSLRQGGPASVQGDLLMLAAVGICGLGYAEGAALSRRLGGWQVICWALLACIPVMVPIMLATRPARWDSVGWPAWAGLGYVSVFSMLVGFVFWYRGLALGGAAQVGQLQLLQPFFSLALAGLVLGEPVGLSTVAVSLVVVACVAGARRYGDRA